MRRPVVVRHRVESPHWRGAPLSAVVFSDLHVVAPWSSLSAVARAVARINALGPDIVLVPGDFIADPKLPGRRADPDEIVTQLERLDAPLGVFATLGNHDWADCRVAAESGYRRNSVREALAGSRIRHLENDAARIERDGGDFWLAGVDSIIGEGSLNRTRPKHDLDAALAPVPGDADVVLMAHEPDLWVEERPQAALTVSGHTHGGQIAFGRWRPLTPSRYGSAYAHGRFQRDGRHLVVSGGFGYTAVPIRIGVPPELTWIDLSREET
ncbi:metallophosphoesterase [Rhodobacterales bacterium HKCCE2091]|nr:metallophosphoesterase [Rhodobacterales bacterium HKCCE2091]